MSNITADPLAASAVRRVLCPQETWRDARGWGMNPLIAAGVDGNGPASLHVVSLKPGAVRGNHAHPDSTEWMQVCGGPAQLVWTCPDNATPFSEWIAADDPALFLIPPGCGHAVRNHAPFDITVVSFSNARKPLQVRCDPPLIPVQ